MENSAGVVQDSVGIAQSSKATVDIDVWGGHVLDFGRHKGASIRELADSNARYVLWLARGNADKDNKQSSRHKIVRNHRDTVWCARKFAQIGRAHV